MVKVRNDLLSRMCHQNKLDVLIHPQSRVGRNRVNQQGNTTFIMLCLEMLNDRGER